MTYIKLTTIFFGTSPTTFLTVNSLSSQSVPMSPNSSGTLSNASVVQGEKGENKHFNIHIELRNNRIGEV